MLDLARRDGLVLNEAGVAAAAAGRIAFERTVLAPGADAAALADAGWISALVADGYLALSPGQRSSFRRYSELDRRQYRDRRALRAAAGVVGVRTPTFGAQTGEVDGGADRLPGTELRSADVGPLVERDLEQRVGADRLDGSVASVSRPSSSTSNTQRLLNGRSSAARSAGVARKTLAPHWVS